MAGSQTCHLRTAEGKEKSEVGRLTGLLIMTAMVLGALAATSVAGPQAPVAPAQLMPAQARPACSLVVMRSGAARTTVKLRVRCNYLVTAIGFRSSLPIRKVRRTTILQDPAPGDRVVCSRRWPRALRPLPRRAKRSTLGGCSGMAGYNTSAIITIAINKPVCRPKRLRVRIRTFGGLDCRGSTYPCASIGYSSTAIRTVAGC
jgi:hypothetical protein